MIYVDTNIIIYSIQDASHLGDAARAALSTSRDELAISPLVRMECLVGPLRSGNLRTHDLYVRALDRFHSLPLTTRQFERAAELRARFGLSTPDSLHLAAAQTHGCRAIWTNDNRLAAAAGGVEVETF